MSPSKENESIDLWVEIGNNNEKEWNEEKINELKQQAKKNAKHRTPEQRIKNELMALKYELDEYLATDASKRKTLTIEKVVGNYLTVLNLPFRQFAFVLDTTDGNLKKYLSGERKFTIDLAMKFGAFFHTSPEVWLLLQLKNELQHLRKEKKQIKRYEKYDYQKVI